MAATAQGGQHPPNQPLRRAGVGTSSNRTQGQPGHEVMGKQKASHTLALRQPPLEGYLQCPEARPKQVGWVFFPILSYLWGYQPELT